MKNNKTKKVKSVPLLKSYIDDNGNWVAEFKEQDLIKLVGKKFVNKILKR